MKGLGFFSRDDCESLDGDGDRITGCAGVRDDFDGDAPSLYSFLNLWDDFLGGGLGGVGDSPLRLLFSFLSSVRTVELDDDDVRASLTTARPWLSDTMYVSASLEVLPALLRVTGGLESAGLACLSLAVGIRIGATIPGDCEDIDVGVVSLL